MSIVFDTFVKAVEQAPADAVKSARGAASGVGDFLTENGGGIVALIIMLFFAGMYAVLVYWFWFFPSMWFVDFYGAPVGEYTYRRVALWFTIPNVYVMMPPVVFSLFWLFSSSRLHMRDRKLVRDDMARLHQMYTDGACKEDVDALRRFFVEYYRVDHGRKMGRYAACVAHLTAEEMKRPEAESFKGIEALIAARSKDRET